MENKVSVKQYAAYRGISKQAVLKRLKQEKVLIYVVNREFIGKLWVLTVLYPEHYMH